MKKLLLLHLVAALLLPFSAGAQCILTASISPGGTTNICGTGSVVLSAMPPGDTWTQKGNFAAGNSLSFPTGFSIGNKGYVGVATNTNTLWEYDPVTDLWTQKANFPMSVGSYSFAAGFSIGSKGYVAVISGTNELLYEYDAAGNTWTQKASPGGGGRYRPFAFGLGGKGYLGTGYDLATYTHKNDFWEYDPTANAWTQKANYGGGGRAYCVSFTVGTQAYVGLGEDSFTAQNDVWQYDPSSNTWTQKASYPGNSLQGVNQGMSLGSKGFFLDALNFASNNLWEYSVSTNSWIPRALYPGSFISFATLINVSGRAYLCGSGTTVWEYDPMYTFSWSTGATTSTISVASTGTYQVSMIAVTGCTAATSQTVAVSAYPALGISGAGNSICSGSTAILTGSGAATYSWSTGATTSTISVTPTASTQYTLTGKNVYGCAVTLVKPIVPMAPPGGTILPGGTGNICVSSATLSVTPTGNQWIQKASFPGGNRSDGVAFSIGGKGYLGLNNFPTNDLWEYDPTTNAWTQKADYPAIGNNYTGFSIGAKGYAAATTFSGEVFYEYDPAANTWTQKASPGTGARSGALCFGTSTKGYFGCGQSGITFYDDFWEYDPNTDTWTQKANIGGGARLNAVGLGIGNKGYAGLGMNSSFSPQNDFWEYDPATNTWTQKANFTGQNYGENLTYNLGSKGYIFQTDYNYMPNLYEYTPASDAWTTVSTFTGTSRYGAAGFSIGDKIYFGTGGMSDFWEYEFPYSLLWSTSATSSSITVSSSATYSVLLTSSQGCVSSASKTITFYSPPVVTANSTSVIACFGGTTSLYGGGASTYTWSNGLADGAAFTVTNNAIYTVTGTAASGCTNTATQNIIVNNNPTVTANASSSVVCLGKTITLNGGGASTYTWTDGRFNGVAFSPTVTTTYTVTGLSFPACTATAAITVSVNPLPSVSSIASSTAICNGGTVSLSGSGATTYTWTGGVTDGSAFSPTSTQSYTVTGAAGTTGCTNTAVKTITVNPLPSVTASASQSIICRNATVTLSGGGASTYSWTGGITNASPFSPTITSTYTVTGTSAANCTNTAVKTITVNNLPAVTANTSSSAICNGTSVTLSGGGATSYSWTNGVTNASPFSPTNTLTYTVTGTDINTCTNTAMVTVTVNPLPNVTANASSATVCSGNTVSLSGSGATTYTWTNGIINAAAFIPTLTTTYTVTGTDAATGCTNTAVKTITVNNTPTVTANASQTIICKNTPVTLSGGGANTYTWTGGVTDGLPFSPTVTSNYSVTGASAAGCTNTAVKTITVNALPLVTAGTSSAVICNGNSITLSGGGASTYTWTNGASNTVPFSPTTTLNYTVTGTDANTCTNTAVVSVTVNPKPNVTANASSTAICNGGTLSLSGSGASSYAWTHSVTDGLPFSPTLTTTYTVTGTNAVTGCTNTAVKTVTVNSLPIVTASPGTAVICMNSTLSLNGGGAATYSWTGGITNGSAFSPTLTGSYTVTGTDINSCTNTAITSVMVNSLPLVTASTTRSVLCNGESSTLNGGGAITYTWTNGITNGLPFSPSVTLTYTVTGTDANTCSNTAVKTITVNPLPAVTANASSAVLCNNGATTTLYGGGADTYTWSGGLTDNTPFVPTSTSSYTVTGTNALTGCTNTAVKTITVNNLPNVTANPSSPAVCNGETVTLTGGGAVTYTWTGGISDASPFSPTLSGQYTVTGTDANSCSNTAITSITVYTLPVVTAGISNSAVCSGAVVVVTGSGADTYTWTGGVSDGVAFSPGATGSYTVTGIDLNNCTNKAVVSVTVNSLPAVTANASTLVLCAGDPVTLYGGGANSYTWTTGTPDNVSFVPLITDSYTVTGTDANGCDNSAAITITVNNLPNVTVNVSDPVICLNHTTSLSGAGAASYSWTGGITDGAAFTPGITDTYSVTGTDANGCINYASQLIVVNTLPVITANASSQVICTGDPLTLNGGGADFYSWSGGALDGLPFTPMVTATYSVIGTDVNLCSNTAAITITVNNSPTVTATASDPVICDGDPATLTGGGALSYVWTSNVNDGMPFNPSVTDTYTVTGTGVNGCTNIAITTITVNALPVVTASANPDVICLNYTTSLSGGGAASYTWTGGITDGGVFSPTLTDTYTVTATDLNGCVNTAIQTITVNTLPPVTGIASNAVICNGDATTLNGSGATSYVWTGGVTDGTAFSPGITTDYTVTGTDANTCSNTAVVTITVNPNPAVTALVSDPAICLNDLTTLNGAGAVSYGWSGGVTDGAAFSPGFSGTYTVTGTSADGCTNTAVASITVNSLPLISGSASTPSVCTGGITSLNGNGAVSYTWTGGAINGIAFSPSATTVYTVTGTDQNGCTNTNTTSVTVSTVPVISAAASQTIVCSGDPVTLTGAGAASYTWTSGITDGTAFSPTLTTSYTLTGSSGGCTSANAVVITISVNPLPAISVNSGSICAGNSFTFLPSGAITYTFSSGPVVSPLSTTSYSISGTDAQGCMNTSTSTVVVNALPVINITSTQNTVCVGNSATLSASGATAYLWNDGSTSSDLVVKPQSNTAYTVSGTDANLCTGTQTLFLSTALFPELDLTSSATGFCKGGRITLTASGAESYLWNTGDTASSISDTPDLSTTYSVTGTSGSACSITKTISITVNAIPTVDAGEDVELQAGQTYQLNASQIGASQYTWSDGEGLSSTSILNPITSIDHDITYTITVTSSKGCPAKDEINIRISDGITIANYMSPNGDGKNDTWKISNLHLIKTCSIEIVDGWGKSVFSKREAYDNEFDANDLPDGVYYYFIKDGSKLKYKGSITITR